MFLWQLDLHMVLMLAVVLQQKLTCGGSGWQEAAAQGWKDADLPPLHSCHCPPCFVERKKNGATVCEPKCDLDQCDQPTGICSAAAITRGAPRA